MSVPEAARAAKWATAFYDYPTERFPDHLWPHIVRLMALANAEVAAASVELQQEVDRLSAECEALRGAVAEERATTGRQPGRWWTVLDKNGDIWCQTSDEKEARRSMRDPECAPYTLHRQWVTVQRSELRPAPAALASPGEGE